MLTRALFLSYNLQAACLSAAKRSFIDETERAMVIMEEKFGKKPDSLCLENRNGLKLTGVTDMGAFDEESVTAFTDYGCLTVSGSGIHIEELSVESGVLRLSGEITALIYSSKSAKEKNIFRRLFGA